MRGFRPQVTDFSFKKSTVTNNQMFFGTTSLTWCPKHILDNVYSSFHFFCILSIQISTITSEHLVMRCSEVLVLIFRK